MEEKKGQMSGSNSELTEALAVFEQILSVVPDDRLALETLYEAAMNAGDSVKALDYLLRLAEVVGRDGPKDAAYRVCSQLTMFSDYYPAAIEQLTKLQALYPPDPTTVLAPPTSMKKKLDARLDISGQLSLAWELHQDGELTQAEYSTVANDLSELSSRKSDEPVSVLHVLHDRGFKNEEKILGHLSRKSGLTVLPLGSFEVPKEMMDILPMDFVVRRGVVVFDRLGSDLLAAVLNPLDLEVQKSVRVMTGAPCHFYLCPAADFNSVLAAMRKAMTKAAPPVTKAVPPANQTQLAPPKEG